MFRNTWRASVAAELSNALAARASDFTETPFEDRTHMLGLSVNHNCPLRGEDEAQNSQKQSAVRVLFFCRCPQMEFLLKSKPVERRMTAEGLGLMSYSERF